VEALGVNAVRYRVFGLAIEPTPETSERLGAMAHSQKACFVASPKFFHSFVPFVRSQLLLPYTSLHVIRDSQDGLEDLARAIEGADIVVHNVGLSSMLDQLHVPNSQRVELAFRFTREAVSELSTALRKTGLATPPAEATSDDPAPKFAQGETASDPLRGGGTNR